jgi:hypothetical protein
MSTKPVIFAVVTLFLAVVLVYNSSVVVFAVPPDPNWNPQGTCAAPTKDQIGVQAQTCCWKERVPGKLPPLNEATYCQTCYTNPDSLNVAYCTPKEQQAAATSSSPLTDRLRPGGDFEELQPLSPSQLPNTKDNTQIQNDSGLLEQQQPDQGTTTQPNDNNIPPVNNKQKRSEDGTSAGVLEQPLNDED